MKHTLTVTSLLTILLLTFHLADDIVRGYEKGGLRVALEKHQGYSTGLTRVVRVSTPAGACRPPSSAGRLW
jgi:hypothetical protein